MNDLEIFDAFYKNGAKVSNIDGIERLEFRFYYANGCGPKPTIDNPNPLLVIAIWKNEDISIYDYGDLLEKDIVVEDRGPIEGIGVLYSNYTTDSYLTDNHATYEAVIKAISKTSASI